MIFNLRGSGGAGKTTVYRHLVDNYLVRELYAPNFRTHLAHKPVVFELRGNLYMLGRYATGTDALRNEPIKNLIRGFTQLGHVFVENVLISGNVATWRELREELGCPRWIWATLDTPEDECIRRIYQRNGGKVIKEYEQRLQWRRVQRRHEQLVGLGEEAIRVNHTRAIEHVEELLRGAGWAP